MLNHMQGFTSTLRSPFRGCVGAIFMASWIRRFGDQFMASHVVSYVALSLLAMSLPSRVVSRIELGIHSQNVFFVCVSCVTMFELGLSPLIFHVSRMGDTGNAY